MKSLIKTYVDPMLEDRIRILASKSESSVSALVSELLNQALNQSENGQREIHYAVIEQQLYLQYLTLIVLLELNPNFSESRYFELKNQAKEWAKDKVSEA
jgi:hypothetical protein